MELPQSDALPSFHDGSFDGMWIQANNKVQSTAPVERTLNKGHIESAYELSNIARDQEIAKLLASARQEGLRLLEMTTSYGVEGIVLFKGIELSERP